ncbi:MAG TPA: TatD family hydrolase [Syntrophorhabdaceae bacterium]|nr:TatD family hydrolase [Syntrophorhabdaceae bacterium]
MKILNDAYRQGNGVIHCFSYDLDYAKRFLDMGLYISIPGTVTYRNNDELARVVKYIPEDRLLAETDAPFLTPHPHRGKRNVPYFVKFTVDKIAQIREKHVHETAVSIRNNFEHLFLNNIHKKET